MNICLPFDLHLYFLLEFRDIWHFSRILLWLVAVHDHALRKGFELMLWSLAEETIEDAVKFENGRIITVELCLGLASFGLCLIFEHTHTTEWVEVSGRLLALGFGKSSIVLFHEIVFLLWWQMYFCEIILRNTEVTIWSSYLSDCQKAFDHLNVLAFTCEISWDFSNPEKL